MENMRRRSDVSIEVGQGEAVSPSGSILRRIKDFGMLILICSILAYQVGNFNNIPFIRNKVVPTMLKLLVPRGEYPSDFSEKQWIVIFVVALCFFVPIIQWIKSCSVSIQRRTQNPTVSWKLFKSFIQIATIFICYAMCFATEPPLTAIQAVPWLNSICFTIWMSSIYCGLKNTDFGVFDSVMSLAVTSTIQAMGVAKFHEWSFGALVSVSLVLLKNFFA